MKTRASVLVTVLASVVVPALMLVLAPSMQGCAATERAQARDPRRCEQNPNCASQRGIYADCSQQCSYDPECTDRCASAALDQSNR